MKKIILSLLLCFSVFASTGCSGILFGLLFGSSAAPTQTSDPKDYGKFDSSVQIPSYYPESVDGYTVNTYCYWTDRYTGPCYEIYLDITLPEESFTSLLNAARNDTRSKTVSVALHSSDYMELIFKNSYSPSYFYYDAAESADIEKVIYSESEKRIIFVLLHVESDGTFPVSNIKYFTNLGIDHSKYSSGANNQI